MEVSVKNLNIEQNFYYLWDSFKLIKNYSEEHIVLNYFHYVIFVSLQFIRSQP
jgi:hypothetical protein